MGRSMLRTGLFGAAALVMAALCAIPAIADQPPSGPAAQRQVRPGEVVTFTATATDPDNGPGPITYTWAATRGALQGSGAVVTLDTTGLEPGPVTVTVSVSDGDPNCVDTESVTINIAAPAPAEIVGLTPCFFARNTARVNNECKAILDDVALRMQQDPRVVLAMDGHSDGGERRGVALGRAENVRDYLVNERGVDANRVIVRSFDDKCPRAERNQNRRVELWLVPEGRTVDEIRKDCPGATPTAP